MFKPWLLVFTLLVGASNSANLPPRIVQNPQSVLVVNITDPVTLECRVSGEPRPVVTWYKNDRLLDVANNNEYTLIRSTDLFIVSAKVGRGERSDTGVYFCRATNSLAMVESEKASLLVAYLKEDFREIPKSRQINSGSSVSMDCTAPRGSPEPAIYWEKSGLPLHINNKKRYLTFPNNTFLIPNATLIDNGEYRCIAQNSAGTRRSAPAFLNVFEKPSFSIKPNTEKHLQGTQVKIECQAKGFPQPLIEWKKDGSIDNLPLRAQITDTTLIIPNIGIQDEGEYTCVASNQLGSIETKSYLIVYQKPVFTKVMSNLTIGIESKSLTIECNAQGRPVPVIYWAKSGQTTSESSRTQPTAGQEDFIILENGNLFIERLSRKYEGTYLCQASNEYGSIETKTNLVMKSVQTRPPPIVVYGPQNQTIPINTQALLECLTSTASNQLFNSDLHASDVDQLQSQYLSSEKVQITWYKNNLQIINTQSTQSKYKIHDTGSLEINSVQTRDSGSYKCVATNTYGSTSSMQAHLKVENPNNQYAEFQRNFETTALPSAPAQPLILLATSSSVSLSWQASSHSGHSPLISYSIECFSPEWPERLPGWIVIANDLPAISSYTVTDLQPDTYYMFMVRARNRQGYGPPSKVSDLSKTLLEPNDQTGGVFGGSKASNDMLERALTGEVVQLNEPAVVLSSSSLKVSWSILKSAGLIAGFSVKYRPIGAKHSYTTLTISEGHVRSSVLTNLDKFVSYEILVEPFSGPIRGSESNIVQAKTLEDVPSMSPDDLQVELDSLTSMSIKWQPPMPTHANGLILGYKINCLANETRFNLHLSTNSTTRAIILGNLIKEMRYCIQIAAFTSKGNGPFTPHECISMSRSFLSNLEITSGQNQSLQDLIETPWFIIIIVIVCLVLIGLLSYCLYTMFRKHRDLASTLSENGSLKSSDQHKIDHGNRYKLVNDNIWLDTLHSNSNQSSNQECCCVPDIHHQIFAQQRGAGLHDPSGMKFMHSETCTQHTNSTNSQPNSNNSSQQPQYAEIYGPTLGIHQGTNPYATSGLFTDQDQHIQSDQQSDPSTNNNPYNIINYQTLNNNRQQLLHNSYTLKMLAEQLQADGQLNSIGTAMTMLNDQKKLLKYLQNQSSTQSQSNTPRVTAKNLQNRVKSENHTNQCCTLLHNHNNNNHAAANGGFQQQPQGHQMIAYLADSQQHQPNSSSTPIPSLPLAPPPSLASALIQQQHGATGGMSVQQQKQLIDGYNNLLSTISRSQQHQQRQSPVQYNMPWNGGNNPSAFTSASRVQQYNPHTQHTNSQTTLIRQHQQSNANGSTFTAQQYAQQRAKAQAQVMQCPVTDNSQQDYSSISPVDLDSHVTTSNQMSIGSSGISGSVNSSEDGCGVIMQLNGGGGQHYANHDVNNMGEEKKRFMPILSRNCENDDSSELYVADMVQTIL